LLTSFLERADETESLEFTCIWFVFRVPVVTKSALTVLEASGAHTYKRRESRLEIVPRGSKAHLAGRRRL